LQERTQVVSSEFAAGLARARGRWTGVDRTLKRAAAELNRVAGE
jgi:hypothetical protein